MMIEMWRQPSPLLERGRPSRYPDMVAHTSIRIHLLYINNLYLSIYLYLYIYIIYIYIYIYTCLTCRPMRVRKSPTPADIPSLIDLPNDTYNNTVYIYIYIYMFRYNLSDMPSLIDLQNDTVQSYHIHVSIYIYICLIDASHFHLYNFYHDDDWIQSRSVCNRLVTHQQGTVSRACLHSHIPLPCWSINTVHNTHTHTHIYIYIHI
jgi:hypothetical protein